MRKSITLGITLILLSVFDHFLTVYNLNHGCYEMNPIMGVYYNNQEYFKALMYKGLLTIPCVYALICVQKESILMVLTGVYAIIISWHWYLIL